MSTFASPQTYEVNVPQLSNMMLKNFEPTILFYIFYNYPFDQVQIDAHNELIGRSWQYDKGQNRWYLFTTDDS